MYSILLPSLKLLVKLLYNGSLVTVRQFQRLADNSVTARRGSCFLLHSNRILKGVNNSAMVYFSFYSNPSMPLIFNIFRNCASKIKIII
jgi:hypothetical protein